MYSSCRWEPGETANHQLRHWTHCWWWWAAEKAANWCQCWSTIILCRWFCSVPLSHNKRFLESGRLVTSLSSSSFLVADSARRVKSNLGLGDGVQRDSFLAKDVCWHSGCSSGVGFPITKVGFGWGLEETNISGCKIPQNFTISNKFSPDNKIWQSTSERMSLLSG